MLRKHPDSSRSPPGARAGHRPQHRHLQHRPRAAVHDASSARLARAGLDLSGVPASAGSAQRPRQRAVRVSGPAQRDVHRSDGAVEYRLIRSGPTNAPTSSMSARVLSNYFDVLGVKPALGRAFVAAEDDVANPARAIVISHDLWSRRFEANPGDRRPRGGSRTGRTDLRALYGGRRRARGLPRHLRTMEADSRVDHLRAVARHANHAMGRGRDRAPAAGCERRAGARGGRRPGPSGVPHAAAARSPGTSHGSSCSRPTRCGHRCGRRRP